MKHLAFVMNIPSPYRLHTFNVIWDECKKQGVEFHVHFMSRAHAGRPQSWLNPTIEFPHTYWNDYGYKTYHFNPMLIIYICLHKNDVIVVGSPFDTFTSAVIGCCSHANVKCAWIEGQTKTPGKMRGFLGLFKRFILSHYNKVAVPGADGAKYIQMHQQLSKYNMPSVVSLPNLIDERLFQPREHFNSKDIDNRRKSLGVCGDELICLTPARLENVKGLIPFVRQLDTKLIVGRWRIVIIGQGPLKKEIEQIATDVGVKDNLKILDYVSYNDMPLYYAASDLMLLPSIHDPNPLSVPEALHSGLPVALSENAGNVEEGVSDGKNGWILPVNNPKLLKLTLSRVFSATRDDLMRMGKWSFQHNAKYWSSHSAIIKFLKEIGG